jgi:hypothetical protein
MKHVNLVSRALPAHAVAGHPSIGDSIKGFLENPIGVIQLHLNKTRHIA